MPANNDGTVFIGVDFDTTPMQKGAKVLENSLKNTISITNTAFGKASASANQYGIKLDKLASKLQYLNDKLAYMQEGGATGQKLTMQIDEQLASLKAETDEYKQMEAAAKELAAQMREIEQTQGKNSAEYNEAEGAHRVLTQEMGVQKQKIEEINASLETMRDKLYKAKMAAVQSPQYEKLKSDIALTEKEQQQLLSTQSKSTEQIKKSTAEQAKSTNQVAKTNAAQNKVLSSLGSGFKRLKSIVAGALFFNVISKALTGLTQSVGSYIQTNKNFMSSLRAAQGNLLTAFQPIWQFITPALNALGRALAYVTGLIANFAAILSGKSLKDLQSQAKALNKNASAIKNVSKATDKAKKSADKASASFDTLNILQTSKDEEDTSQNDSGGSSGGISTPDFDSAAVELDEGLLAKMKEVKEYLSTTFEPAFAAINANVVPQLDNLKTTFKGIFSDVSGWGDPFLDYITNTFMPSVALRLSNLAVVAGGALESLNMVISDLWGTAFEPFFESFITEGLPRITEFGNQVSNTFTIAFGEAKKIFDSVWTYGIMPAVELLATIFGDVWQIIKDTWDEYGQPIFDGFNQTVQTVSNLIQKIWKTIIEPIWTNLINIITELWKNHLKPLVANIAGMVAEFIIMAQTIYNNVIAPIISWIVDTFGPMITTAVNSIFNTVSTIVASVIDIVNGIITVLRGIIQFITGVFSGDWQKAWEGIKKVFKGIWDTLVSVVKAPINIIISLINGLISGVCSGINTVIKALNNLSFDVPDWVPVLGGKKFGFDLKTIKAPKIPKLATGAVIPPNREFLAVLGDQKRGTNIEAPLDTIVEAFQRVQNNGVNDVNIKFSGNEGQLLRYLFNGLEVTKSKRGLAFVK